MRFVLPPRGALQANNAVDPLRFYYKPAVGRLFRARLDAGLRLLPEGARYARILELGYGSGLLLPTLAPATHELHGVDLERPPAGARAALEKLGAAPRLLAGDLAALPYRERSFELVVAFSVLEHLKRPALERALGEAARVLQPGGALLVGCPAVHRAMNAAFLAIGFSGIEDHHFSSIDDVRDAAAPGFTVERAATMPGFLQPLVPLAWSPYSAILFRKR